MQLKIFIYFALQSTFMAMQHEQLDDIREIRNIMERSTRFISLSGLSGVFAGFFALAGAAAFYIYINKQLNYGYSDFAREFPVNISLSFKRFCVLDAATVLVLSLLSGIFFTTRRARQTGQKKLWDASVRRLIVSLAIPLVAGGLYCLILLMYGWFGMIAPTMLIFYGLALLNASKYTLDEIRWLGISEIVLGLIACFYIGWGITFWSIGFGILHIIYGLVMYVRYEAKPVETKYW